MQPLSQAVLAMMILASGNAAFAEDWTRWRGPRADGVSLESNWTHDWPADGPPIAWRQSVGTGFSSVVIANGLVYTMGNDENTDMVFCLDASTGKVLWKHSYPCALDDRDFEGGPTSTPTVDGDSVYTLSRTGELFCFDAASGDVSWHQQVADLADVRIPGWGFSASPVVVGDLLLLNVGDAGAAVNKSTGTLVWKSEDKDAGYGTPTLYESDGKHIAIVPSGRSYVAIDVATGVEQWRQRWLTSFGCNAADPIIDGGRVFLSSAYNRGSALLKITDGTVELIWKGKQMQNQLNASVRINENLFGVDGDVEKGSRLTCIRLDDGEILWSESALRPGALAATPDRLFVITVDGELVIVKVRTDSYEELARARVLSGKCWTVPVLSNRRIYCRSAAGTLVCVDVSDGKQ